VYEREAPSDIEQLLVFDTETRSTPDQRLIFLVWRLVIDIAYASDLDAAETALLRSMPPSTFLPPPLSAGAWQAACDLYRPLRSFTGSSVGGFPDRSSLGRSGPCGWASNRQSPRRCCVGGAPISQFRRQGTIGGYPSGAPRARLLAESESRSRRRHVRSSPAVPLKGSEVGSGTGAPSTPLAHFAVSSLPPVRRHVEEGCLVVDMEAAALLAVGEFRHVPVGVYLLAGDDIAGSKSNESRWRKDVEIHANLLRPTVSAAIELAEARRYNG